MKLFSSTQRYVVEPANTSHVVVQYSSSGRWYVWVERWNGTEWSAACQALGFGEETEANALAKTLYEQEVKR